MFKRTTGKAKNGAAFTKAKGGKASKPRRDLHAEITDRVVKALEGGAMPWLQPWTTGARHVGHPRNAHTRRKYNGINILLLWLAQHVNGYTSSEWLSYKQAKERGGHVRKGEKGTEIIFYKQLSFKEMNEQGEEEERNPLLMRSYTVFNVEQCDDLRLPDKSEPVFEPMADPDHLNPAFMAMVDQTGADIRHGGGRAYYSPSLDTVHMPNLETFRDGAHYQATMAHELIHWTGHKSRLDRLDAKTQQGYAAEELVAEMGAAFLCAEYGIEGDLRHEGYIESWVKALKEDKKAIFRAASRASKAAAFLSPDKTEQQAAPAMAEAA